MVIGELFLEVPFLKELKNALVAAGVNATAQILL